MQDQITIDSFVESTIRWQNLMRIKFAKFAHLQEKSEKSASCLEFQALQLGR